MPRFKITDAFISNLQKPTSGNRVHFGDVHGFGVRITARGVIAFVYNYRINGRQRRYTIGEYPGVTPAQARNKAQKLRSAVESGVDPLDQRQREQAAPTIAELASEYLRDPDVLKKRPYTLRNERNMLRGIITPKLGRLKVQSVGRNDVAKLHKSLEATPYQANRVLAQISILFTFAIREHLRIDNPARGVKKFHEERRNRWLTNEELDRLSSALDSYTDQTAANSIRLLLLTGAREGEVLSAAWQEFDLHRGIWTKPSHHTKQKRTEHVTLSDAAITLLKQMAKQKQGEHLFPGKSRGARVSIRRPWKQVCKSAGLGGLRIHDLRHNFASYLVSSGVSLHIVGRLLGHTQPQTTARYAHLADSPLREAANKFPKL
jgi:integrase